MLMRYDPFRELDRFTDQVFGSPTRSPWVPMDAVRHGDTVEARFEDGVLRVTIPVAEQAKPRKVEIHTGRTQALPAQDTVEVPASA